MENIKKHRFENVEFLRFIFAIFIVMFHCANYKPIKPILAQVIPGVCNAHICVDFFFIIAGFFLFYTLKPAQSTFEFAKKRFLRLAPLLWLFLIFQAILSLVIHTKFSVDGNILKLFLLHNIGFAPNTGGNGSVVSWFISVLFWDSLFYFYLVKIIDKKYLNFIMWIITISCLGFGMNVHHGHTANVYYFINTGIVRGLYGMGIGYFVYMLYNSGFLKNCSKGVQNIISILEIFCLSFLGGFLIFTKNIPGKSFFLFILFFTILFYLFLVKKGWLSGILNNKLSSILGSFSYAIYVTHPTIFTFFNKVIYPNAASVTLKHIGSIFIAEVIISIIFGILIHYLFENPVNKLIKNKTK